MACRLRRFAYTDPAAGASRLRPAATLTGIPLQQSRQQFEGVLKPWGIASACDAVSSRAPRPVGLLPRRRATSAESAAQTADGPPHVLGAQAAALLGARAVWLVLLGRRKGVLCEQSYWWRTGLRGKYVQGTAAACAGGRRRRRCCRWRGAPGTRARRRCQSPAYAAAVLEHPSLRIFSATNNFLRRGRLSDGQGE